MLTRRKRVFGTVVSVTLDGKTAKVFLPRTEAHPVYKKVCYYNRYRLVDTGDVHCVAGDFVALEETRPISRRKTWRVVLVLKSSDSDGVQ